MVDVVNIRCLHKGCTTQPKFNLPTEKRGLYCSKHAVSGMINITSKQCEHDGCPTEPSFNLPSEPKGIYCSKHALEGMVNIKGKLCGHQSCKEDALYGYKDGRAQFCKQHHLVNMINVVVDRQCDVCTSEYDVLMPDGSKYCLQHSPEEMHEVLLKRLCKYCDIQEASPFVCKECNLRSNKKEWAVVRYLRRNIQTPFSHDTSSMLQGCSKRRPDIFFDFPTHCVIVEIDEFQHRGYEDSCECARLCEIVSAVGGRPVTVIRFNPDSVRHNGRLLTIPISQRLELLVKSIKEALVQVPTTFEVRLVQLYYTDNDKLDFQARREENITTLVAV